MSHRRCLQEVIRSDVFTHQIYSRSWADVHTLSGNKSYANKCVKVKAHPITLHCLSRHVMCLLPFHLYSNANGEILRTSFSTLKIRTVLKAQREVCNFKPNEAHNYTSTPDLKERTRLLSVCVLRSPPKLQETTWESLSQQINRAEMFALRIVLTTKQALLCR